MRIRHPELTRQVLAKVFSKANPATQGAVMSWWDWGAFGRADRPPADHSAYVRLDPDSAGFA